MQTTYPHAAAALMPMELVEPTATVITEVSTVSNASRIARLYPPVFTGKALQVQIAPRLADVLIGAMRGESNKQIGKRLHLAEDTVKTHMRRLFAAIGAKDRAHAVALFTTGEVELFIRDTRPGRRRVSAASRQDV